MESTNPYTDYPITGVNRNYDFTIERGTAAPDGVERSVILVNGQFPGPLIEANWGDTVNVKVHNRISGPEEGTSLHWHGLNQKVTPWYDGVPSVQQCPIAPGSDFEYSFVVTNYGSSWWHSHYSAQYAAGIYGPMIIHGPVQTTVEYDCDLGPVMIGDHYHEDYFTLVEQVMTAGAPPPRSANNLINGKAAYACPDYGAASTVTVYTNGTGTPTLSANGETATCVPNANVAKFEVQKGKKYRLRLINTSAEAVQRFSIDGHNVTVFANDFVPVQPYTTDVITLGVGQRSDVVLDATASGGAFWIRSNISTSLSNTNQGQARAALYYSGANTNNLPTSAPSFAYNDAAQPGNDDLSLTAPVYPLAVAEPDLTLNMVIGVGVNGSGITLFNINNSSFRADYNDPLLLEAHNGNTSFPEDPQWNVYNTGNAKSVRIVLTANVTISHPMHLHGHDFYVLAQGHGAWDGTITRPTNPQRRDVQLFPKVGTTDTPGVPNPDRPYLVLQYDQDNPGVWPFHCHIAWHVSAGLYVNLIERPANITQLNIPGNVAQTCRAWSDYTGDNVVDDIDSGL